MNILWGLQQWTPLECRSVLTVGNFDGVHVGHQEILRKARGLADSHGLPVIALTFDPHPLAIVAPSKAPEQLMSVSQRVRLLGEAGADHVVVAESTPKLLGLEAAEFVTEILWAKFRPLHMVEGTTFGFGKGRKGTPNSLREWLRPLGSGLHVVEPVAVVDAQGVRLTVSSSMVRKFVREGDVERAARCLGRPYTVESAVIHGAGRGRKLGIPTANFQTPPGMVEPGEGVYAGMTDLGDARYASAISVGRAETFGAGSLRLESHLLDFQGDLYGRTIRVEFQHRIRGQMKFASPEELIAQIRKDVAEARRTLAIHA